MKFLLFMIFIFSFLLILSCGDESKTDSKKECNPSCNTWQTCNSELKCVLLEGRCTEDADCKDNTEGKTSCNKDNHECVKPKLGCNSDTDCKDNTDGKTTCDKDNHECVEPAELTCNEDKTPSNFKLPADECGELTQCNDSYDCADNQRCENLYNEVNEFTRACCVDGLRGCKKVGETCEDEFDCESGLCIAKNEGQKYCSKTCDPDNNDCPSPISECKDLYIMHACVEPKAE